MQFLSGKAMPRRQFLQGMSATIALPYLDAMIPIGRGGFGNAKQAPRLVAIEMVHGAAGCNEWGAKMNLWSPAAAGRQFDLSPTALTSLENYRDYLTIVSNTDVREAEPITPNEIGGDHFRSSAVFLTHSHPKHIARARAGHARDRRGFRLQALYAGRVPWRARHCRMFFGPKLRPARHQAADCRHR